MTGDAGLVGFVGWGAVARQAYAALHGTTAALRCTVLLRPGSTSRDAVPAGVTAVDDVPALLRAEPHLVVEAAGQHVVGTVVRDVLAAGVPVLVASTGAFAEPGLLEALTVLARAHGTRLHLSAGAVAGLDYVAAVAQCPEARLRYTSRKPPAAWSAELRAMGHDAAALPGEIPLFEGTAEDAARLYPRNLNVALTLRHHLGGPPGRMRVRVVADPGVQLNTHEIEVDSSIGTAALRFGNASAVGNPKTSALTGYMLASEIRRLLE